MKVCVQRTRQTSVNVRFATTAWQDLWQFSALIATQDLCIINDTQLMTSTAPLFQPVSSSVAYLEIWKGGPGSTSQAYIVESGQNLAYNFFTLNLVHFFTSKRGPRHKGPPLNTPLQLTSVCSICRSPASTSSTQRSNSQCFSCTWMTQKWPGNGASN